MARAENDEKAEKNDEAELTEATETPIETPTTAPKASETPQPEAATNEEAMPCPVYDQMTGRPCGEPMAPDRLTCKEHDTRSSSTQISRLDAARRRYGV